MVNRAIDQVCTVGRTLKSGTTVNFEASDVGPDARLTAWVHGRVQGVGFRWWTRCRALELGLTGYAANQADGRVLVVAQGPRRPARNCYTCWKAARHGRRGPDTSTRWSR